MARSATTLRVPILRTIAAFDCLKCGCVDAEEAKQQQREVATLNVIVSPLPSPVLHLEQPRALFLMMTERLY